MRGRVRRRIPETWWNSLTESEQDSIEWTVRLLKQLGPLLPDLYGKPVVTSGYSHMRELRVQYGGEPIRILYAFDPRRGLFCFVAATRPETTDGTRSLYQRQRFSTSNPFVTWRRKKLDSSSVGKPWRRSGNHYQGKCRRSVKWPTVERRNKCWQ